MRNNKPAGPCIVFPYVPIQKGKSNVPEVGVKLAIELFNAPLGVVDVDAVRTQVVKFPALPVPVRVKLTFQVNFASGIQLPPIVGMHTYHIVAEKVKFKV